MSKKGTQDTSLSYRLTTELLHEANIPMGVEGQSVWCYAQCVEEVGGSDALQGQNTLCTHCPHLLLRQTTVPQRKDVCQRNIFLWTKHKHTQPWVCTLNKIHSGSLICLYVVKVRDKDLPLAFLQQ